MLQRAIIGVLAILLAGCAHRNYSAVTMAIPINTEKHAGTISLEADDLFVPPGVTLKASFNPIKNVSLTGSFMLESARYATNVLFSKADLHHKSRSQTADLAIGGWNAFGDARFHAGIFLGAGLGRTTNDYGNYNFSQLRYRKASLQPSLTFDGGKWQAGLGLRATYLFFYKGAVDLKIPSDELTIVEKIERKPDFLLFDMGLNIGRRFHDYTLWLYLLKGSLANGKGADYHFDLDNIAFGISYNLGGGKLK